MKTLCPQCSATRRHSRDRCLSVDLDRGLFKCHHCGFAGSLARGAEHEAYGRRAIPVAYAKPKPLPIDGLTSPVLAWFASRGIPESVVREAGITSDGASICFPYRRDGELVNVKHRASGKRFWMETGAERIFYGLDWCRGFAQLAIVEGELDALALRTAGIAAVLSVPDGAPAPGSAVHGSKFDFMDSGALLFQHAHTVLLAVDGDGPGRALERELARRIGKEKCYRVRWPDGCKDANDVLLAHGAAAIRDCLADAQPYPIAGIVNPQDLRTDFHALYERGIGHGLSTGWPSLDVGYTVKPGQLTVVTGIPGSGKSEFLDAIMVNLARMHNWIFTVYSPENYPPELHLQKWAEKYVGKPLLAGRTERMTWDEAEQALDWAADHLDFLMPDESDLGTLLDLAAVQVYRRGVQGVVLDPWNDLDHTRPRELSETEYISRCLKQIREFARLHEVHVWVLAHPRMLQKDKEGNYSVPTPYEIAGSAHWFNRADNCLAVWRDKTNGENPVEIHVQKIRFRECGSLGVCGLKYDRPTGRYFDIGRWTPAGG